MQKQRTVKILSLLIVMIMVFTAVPAVTAYAEEDLSLLRKEICTGHNPADHLQLTISGDELTVEGCIYYEGLTYVWIDCIESEQIIFEASCSEPFSKTVSLTGCPSWFQFTVCITNGEKYSNYMYYLYKDVFVREYGGEWYFQLPPNYGSNLELTGGWVNFGDMLYSDGYVRDSALRSLSDMIAEGAADDYGKLFLLHSWVANNIYYDNDTPSNDTYKMPEDVAAFGRAVCEGYARLLCELVRLQGIPCAIVTCMARGERRDGPPGDDFTDSFPALHSYAEAFVNGRWVIMDPTWDSLNKYRDGQYVEEKAVIFHHFDISEELLAWTHMKTERRFTSVNEWQVSVTEYTYDDFTYSGYGVKASFTTTAGAVMDLSAEGTKIMNDYMEKYNVPLNEQGMINNLYAELKRTAGEINTPSKWAREEVSASMYRGLIPLYLQNRYRTSITRKDFCALIVEILKFFSGARDCSELLGLAGVSMPGSSPFGDTDDANVITCSALGIVNGTGDGLFSPENTLTREQAATILCRAAGTLSADYVPADISFEDNGQISSWAYEGIRAVVAMVEPGGNSVMGGVSATAFSPKGPYTREQSVISVYRLLEYALAR